VSRPLCRALVEALSVIPCSPRMRPGDAILDRGERDEEVLGAHGAVALPPRRRARAPSRAAKRCIATAPRWRRRHRIVSCRGHRVRGLFDAAGDLVEIDAERRQRFGVDRAVPRFDARPEDAFDVSAHDVGGELERGERTRRARGRVLGEGEQHVLGADVLASDPNATLCERAGGEERLGGSGSARSLALKGAGALVTFRELSFSDVRQPRGERESGRARAGCGEHGIVARAAHHSVER
jgi:hypothetical protein